MKHTPFLAVLAGFISFLACADVAPEDLPAGVVRSLISTNRTNRLGCDRVVIPPFTPISSSKSSISVLLRRQEFGPLGLPASITALDRELMAEPAYLELVRHGRVLRVEGPTPAVRVASDGCTAQIRSEATADGVVFRSDIEFEYDGFQWHRLSVYGTSTQGIDRLTLVLPLRDCEMPLMHVCTLDSIRRNPAGRVPSGEGLVWDGTRLFRETWYRNPPFRAQIVPYIWLGAERRGLCWFANNSAAFRIADDRPSVRLVRRNGVLKLEIDLVNQPSLLKDGHTFAFGLEATPVKHPDRTFRRHFQNDLGQCPDGMVPRVKMPFYAFGYWNWARHPIQDDWSLFDAAFRRVVSGQGDAAYRTAYEAFTNRYDHLIAHYARGQRNVGRQTFVDWFKGCRGWEVDKILACKKPCFLFKYSDPTLNWRDDANQTANNVEWSAPGESGYPTAYRNFLTPSYIDYIVQALKNEIDHGMKGFYFDDMFPMASRRPGLCGEWDETGKWHGDFGILQMREIVKRAATLQFVSGIRPGFIQIHMTNCLLVPSFAFATSILSWEDHYGEEVFQKRFPIDYIRAETVGTQIGAEAVAIDGIQRRTCDLADWKKGRFRFLSRTQMAVTLPAGIRPWIRPDDTYGGVDREFVIGLYGRLTEFGAWEEDCRFVAFYDDDGAIGGLPKDVLVATYRRPGRTLIIFSNLSAAEVEFDFTVAAEKLKLAAASSCCDLETGALLAGSHVRLPGYDFRLIEVQGQVK